MDLSRYTESELLGFVRDILLQAGPVMVRELDQIGWDFDRRDLEALLGLA
jgi:hypothetical protein